MYGTPTSVMQGATLCGRARARAGFLNVDVVNVGVGAVAVPAIAWHVDGIPAFAPSTTLAMTSKKGAGG